MSSTSPGLLLVVALIALVIVAGAAALERLVRTDPVVDAAWTRFVEAMRTLR
jgi:hypothetical protein